MLLSFLLLFCCLFAVIIVIIIIIIMTIVVIISLSSSLSILLNLAQTPPARPPLSPSPFPNWRERMLFHLWYGPRLKLTDNLRAGVGNREDHFTEGCGWAWGAWCVASTLRYTRTCVRVYVQLCKWACMCVCICERAHVRARARGCVCACVHMCCLCENARAHECVCVCDDVCFGFYAYVRECLYRRMCVSASD